ncbi:MULTISPECIES: rod shape-determining protein [Chryseobacterium]|jgi:cell shape determining protein, MreB/Mrl family|uniref:Cell shape-determining protein MreB n=1 Tax=Chryseobacterium rhizosphaerae TaxID=395937 RepID=A0AAE3Y5E2_9FLAO|nr:MULTISPECIES: rod shape-determining protein [Chryseobacterium]MBL3548035.1 rod shape-determining protein [Chryseobacterium sp. KMC2]MDC8100703.1 rod shape-determining protein [Chryseobacterium rhizosphaerae]MDR6525733.1 rod shape-determining protein MreB [Chryseobacterium rhizosphaerae]MDR6545085.1 rod shape-determining protein MreB [Chryseobacterium rhizosphaerae]REC74727.1 rod shape-determining protein [Chryseobacterium rhizosphaerae]
MGLFDMFTQEIAIDLGTANTLIIHNNKIVIDQPSIVAIDRTTGKPIAVGEQAKLMQGKTHENIKTIRPLKDGVIADFHASEHMIKEFIKQIPGIRGRFIQPALRIVICIPSGITEVEKRAVKDSAQKVNAKEVKLIYEPMAAAIGAGIDVQSPEGNMIIDIGGGTTEIAVVALGGIVCDKSLKIAGDVFTNDIAYFLRSQYNLYIGERTAERIKIEIGSALEELDYPLEDIPVQGRDLITGKPKEIMVNYKEVFKALDKSLMRIEDAVLETLSLTPPELAADIYKTGIYLAGGGALLNGLADRIHRKTGLPVCVAEDPLRAVVRGTGIALKNINKFRFLMNS